MYDANSSSWKMMTVLGMWETETSPRQDNILQFMSILFLKVQLNVLIMIPCSRSLWRSLIGYSATSLFFADCLLLFSVIGAWLLRERVHITVSLCFILAHASTVYSVLPLPVLVLGYLDHIYHLRHYLHPVSPCRVVTYSTVVVFLWVLSCLYSYTVTDAEVMELRHIHKYELCTVQSSSVVTYFSVGLFVLIMCVLIFCHREAAFWLRSTISHLGLCWLSGHRGLLYGYTELQEQQGKGEGLVSMQSEGCYSRSSFLLSLIFGFTTSWAPFLSIITSCWLLNLNTPSYVSFNLLWLLCVNSFVVGTVLSWSNVSGLCFLPIDYICDWGLYQTFVHWGYCAWRVYTLSEKKTETMQHV